MVFMLAVLMMMSEQPASPVQTSGVGFYVATYIDVRVNSTSEGMTLVKQYRDAMRAEKGNAGADFVQEMGRPSRFVIVEFWKDQSSFEAHEKAAHTAQFRSKLKAIQNSPYDQRVHQGLAVDQRLWSGARGAVSVVTHVDVPPPSKDQTEALLKRLAEESRKDDGNLRYDVFQQTAPRTNHFTIFAVWKDRNAFDAHDAKPHTSQFREMLAPMLGAPYDERLYTAQ
jgi:quinol monooxygenase YgiN